MFTYINHTVSGSTPTPRPHTQWKNSGCAPGHITSATFPNMAINRLLQHTETTRASAHERGYFFLPRQPIISSLCARQAKGTLRPHISLTIWCSQYARYTSTRHLLCHSMFYDHTIAEIWMLSDVQLQINSGKKNLWNAHLGTVSNKRRIFHCAIDVCPDFTDVIVKT